MFDVAYITNAAATLAFTAGSKTVTVTGTNPILEGVLRGDRAVDPNGVELAIDVVAAGSLTLLRNAPTSGTVQFDIAPVSRLRTSNAANAEVTRAVYAKQLAAAEDNRSIPVISLATAPPGSPADGDRHLVIATATGAFAGKEGYIAQYDAANTRWIFIAPIAGMKVTVDGSAVIRVYTGSAWAIAPPISSATTVGRLARFTDTAGGLGQSQMSEDGSGNVTVVGTLTVGSSGVYAPGLTATTGAAGINGYAALVHGDATASGYVAFYHKDGTRRGYIGNASGGYINAVADGGYGWNFAGDFLLGGELTLSRSNSGGATQLTVANTATGAPVSARLSIQTGTANSLLNVRLADNSGSPFAIEECGAAVTAKYFNYPLHVFRSQAGTEWARINGTSMLLAVPLRLPSYTVGTVPSAATSGAGAEIYVTNESGGAVPAFSDGTSWRRVTDRAIIS